MTIASLRPGERRAFVLPIVLMLILVSSLLLAAAFSRHDSQRRIVSRQLVEYQRHHEMFGVRAITRQWVEASIDQLPALLGAVGRERDRAGERGKREGEFDYGFVLPSGVEIRVYVADGQGVPHTQPGGLADPTRIAYESLLARLPAGKPNLRRRVGPPLISINGAPREVLAAMVDDEGEEFAERILRERRRGPLDREALDRILRSRGVDDAQSNAIMGMVAFQPSLYRLDIHAADDHGDRYFNMLLEPAARAGQIASKLTIHEWFEVPPPADEESQGEARGRGSRARQSTSRR